MNDSKATRFCIKCRSPVEGDGEYCANCLSVPEGIEPLIDVPDRVEPLITPTSDPEPKRKRQRKGKAD